ncbi:LLM class flavin-dependent oxidoreductase [Nonomuraea jabiensis]|uniref:Alkanesulfonate monooxygenase SsuD/methylene tetrahydromethanopterin reductase-like flavin-dependent oxidoreductase (Luciferase family) n=1 Tax=Nonomuraea jabiensis TaxID=882448 RepID=A0A7W9GG88_9ACTN|nr:LLM class flavin-dependent oxidoreductase [Nonomuraea jabiensis]MBB5783219.1 alkanesulfonate monooxygenase SsuD/methylene tetrahydromethanopterin reductase-like flavin-dependent oxidoreductase (luciferase family) [Nonomuraea jabiensis]
MSGGGAVPLSVLDLSPITSGGTAAGALRETLDLARHAERLGYSRYWIAEHHLSPSVAAAAPAVLIALVVSATDRLRVGSGAALIANSTPLLLAEQFGTIAQLHPGRVDLGLGRSGSRRFAEVAAESGKAPPGGVLATAPGTVVNGVVIPARTSVSFDTELFRVKARLLGQVDGADDDYSGQVRDVLSFLRGDYRTDQGVALRALPAEDADLQVWILGSSAGASAAAAGEHGLPYAANYHLGGATVLESVAAYRAAFRPSEGLAKPYVMVSADVIVAENDESAARLAAPTALWVLNMRRGLATGPFPSTAEAEAHEWTDEERAYVADRISTQIAGSPATVVSRLRRLADVTGADELLVTTITARHADRVRSYELLAKAWK